MTATSMIVAEDADRFHITYVQVRPDGFFASCCSCGSDPFPDRRRLADAEADARAHGVLHQLYPREQLVARDEALHAG